MTCMCIIHIILNKLIIVIRESIATPPYSVSIFVEAQTCNVKNKKPMYSYLEGFKGSESKAEGIWVVPPVRMNCAYAVNALIECLATKSVVHYIREAFITIPVPSCINVSLCWNNFGNKTSQIALHY